MQTHSLTIAPKYLQMIKSGLKTVEGRVAKPTVKLIEVGDRILFTSRSQPDGVICGPVVCHVVAIQPYVNFESMLQQEGVENCLPGFQLEEATQEYLQLPNYAQLEKSLGVVALRIKLLDGPENN